MAGLLSLRANDDLAQSEPMSAVLLFLLSVPATSEDGHSGQLQEQAPPIGRIPPFTAERSPTLRLRRFAARGAIFFIKFLLW